MVGNVFGVPQGSILQNDIDIANYADNSTHFVMSSKTNLAIEKLEQCLDSFFTWFQMNRMKANADKCHF